MLNNVKEFGACGDGVSDDRVAIQAAIDDTIAHRRAGILFPAGTYRVSRAPEAGERWSLDLNGVQDFMIAGEGPKSIVKLVDTSSGTGDWHVFILRNNCQRVVFKDLVIDGNHTGLTDPDEQSHGIEVEDGTEDLTIDRCILRECFGDGMRLLGKAEAAGGKNVRRLRIENCLFQNNKRSGLGMQRALEQIVIANCFFDNTISDQSIDFEPSGSDAPADLTIHGCIINHTNRTPAVALSGIRGPEPLVRCKFTNNIVLGGQIFCTDVDQLTVQNNVVIVSGLEPRNRIPVQVQRGGDSVIITGNLLVNDDPLTESVITLSEVNRRQVTRALVANNLCFARVRRGITCQSCDDVLVQGNMIVATGSCTQGIFVDSESSEVDNISVHDNSVMVKEGGTWTTGIQVNAREANPVFHISILNNAIHGSAEGIRFAGKGFQRTPVCALNRVGDGVASPLVGLQFLPETSITVGGAVNQAGTAGMGVGRFIAGITGDSGPNGKITGNIGDIFQRLDGGIGSTFYVKESDNGENTGWVVK